MKFKSEVQLEALNNATVDTDKFLVSDSSTVKYRTGAQVLSDIGGQAALTNPITGTGTLNYVSKFTGATTLGNSGIFETGTDIGIGTTTPLSRVQITGTATGDVLTLSSKVPFLGGYILTCNDIDDAPLFAVFGNIANSNYVVGMGDWFGGVKPSLQITNDGSYFLNTAVGINTFSPSQALHVAGNARVTGAYYDSTNSPGTSGQVLSSTVTGTDWITLPTGNISGSGTTNYVAKFTGATAIGDSQIFDNGTNVLIGNTSNFTSNKAQIQTTGSSRLLSLYNTTANGGAKIEFFDGTSNGAIGNLGANLVFYINSRDTERMRISSTGNVGIGNTSPTAIGTNITTLDIKGSVGGGIRSGVLGGSESTFYTIAAGGYLGTISNIPLNFQTNNSVKATILANGNVGIGTTSPSFPLSFGTGLGNKIAIYDAGGSNGYGFGVQPSLLQMFSNAVGDDITFGYGNSASMVRNVTFKGTGNVGIGIENPVAKLDVFSSGTVQTAVLGRGLDGNFRLVTAQDVSTNADQSVIGLIGLDYITTPNAAVRFHRGGSTTGGFITFTTNNGNERMRITSDGNVGIGTTSPPSKVSISGGTLSVSGSGSGFGVVKLGDPTDANPYVGMYRSAAASIATSGNFLNLGGYDGIAFTTGAAQLSGQPERMRITSAGAMGLGVIPTNTSGRFEASNDIVAYSSSDKRWKTNIKNIDSPLEKIYQINGVEFDWIEDEPVHGNKGHDIGVIAQEIEKILPDAVQTRESGMKAVKYEKVIPLLIEAVKEQQKQIDELKQILNGITN